VLAALQLAIAVQTPSAAPGPASVALPQNIVQLLHVRRTGEPVGLQALLGSPLLLFLLAPVAPRPMLFVAATNVALQLATVVSHLTIV